MSGVFDYRGKRPLGPDDLRLLRAVLMEYCDACPLDRKGVQALAAARELLRLHQAGIVDPERLREQLDLGFCGNGRFPGASNKPLDVSNGPMSDTIVKWTGPKPDTKNE